MAYFAAGQRKMNWKKAAARAVLSAALPAFVMGSFGAASAWADTTGNSGGLVTGGFILNVMGFQTGFTQLNPSNGTFTAVDYTGSSYGFIRNDYMGVVQGVAGSYSISYPTPIPAISHQVAGMLSFGNQTGSLTYTSDDKGPLNGSNFTDPSAFAQGGQTQGYGVWPLASRWTGTNAFTYGYDYSAYTRAQIDGVAGTTVNVVGGDGTPLQVPTYVNGVLTSQFLLLAGTGGTGGGPGGTGTVTSGNVTLTQELSLYRATARIRYRIINSDSISHTVALRFVVNVRGSDSASGSPTQNQTYTNSGFYFQDPNRGVSNLVTLFSNAQIPDQLNIYGRRYDDPANNISPAFAARHTFRGYGATPPTQLYVADPGELRPDADGFAPGILNPQPNFLPVLDRGIATASYFGPYTLAPGQAQEVITFYGNGTPTELLNDDFVTATEARESLAFNAGAALNAGVAGNKNATNASVGTQFLAPNPLTVYGGIYNRVPSTPQTNVNLTNASAALVLPQGLVLYTDPTTGVQDTAQKTLGNNGVILGDKDATTSWQIQPNAEAFGALPYLMTVSTAEFGARTATRLISVPATPLHAVTAASFQMIGFPFQFDPVLSNNGDPSTVINDLTAPADEPVAFYQWVPDSTSVSGVNGRYVLASRLNTGVGYFYRPNLNRLIFAKGVQPVPGQATTGSDTVSNFSFTGNLLASAAGIGQVQINLERGWNMISNPYLYNIPLNFLRFVPTDSNPGAASQTFTDAVNSSLVRGGVFFYNVNTKSYDFFDQTASPLTPWQGYWLFTNSRVALVYTLPTQRNSVVLPTPDPQLPEPPTRDFTKNNTKPSVPLAASRIKWGALESGRALVKQPVPENWKLQLIATKQSGATDKSTIIGVSPTGRDVSTSVQNLPKPPPPFADYVYLGIVRGENETRFAQDIKGPNGVKTWTVDVQSDTDGPVTVQWPTLAKIPKRVALYVTQNGRKINLHDISGITVDTKRGQTTRLVFTAASQATQPLSLRNVQTIRVGGRGVSGGSMKIAFDLSKDAQVTGFVQTLGGALVAPLQGSGKAFTLGQGSLLWTGRAQNGSALPAGTYNIVLTAKDDTSTVTSVIPVTTLR